MSIKEDRLIYRHNKGTAVPTKFYVGDLMGVSDQTWKGLMDIFNKLADYEQGPPALQSPFEVGDTVYVICKCEDITMSMDNDYHTGTGYISCPFEERECIFNDCEDTQKQVLQTTIACVLIDDDGIHFGLSDICYDVPEYDERDIGNRIFKTREEAERALSQKEK